MTGFEILNMISCTVSEWIPRFKVRRQADGLETPEEAVQRMERESQQLCVKIVDALIGFPEARAAVLAALAPAPARVPGGGGIP